jgi:hypothetical protein
VGRSDNWLLVETLDQSNPGVVAVGATPKKRIPLTSFVRESDRSTVKAAVAQCCRRRSSVVGGTSIRPVVVDPILDDQSGSVFGAWVRIGTQAPAGSDRPSAWTFTWNLETGVARRGPITSSEQSWASLGIDQVRSLSSGLAHLDLGSSVTPVLAKLIDSEDGSTLQERAVEHRPDGSTRRIQFYARFSTQSRNPSTGQEERMLHGVTVDLGPYDSSAESAAAPPIGDLIAKAATSPDEFRVVMDPSSFEFLYWYGTPPDQLRWNHSSPTEPAGTPVLHTDDLPRVQRAVSALTRLSSRPEDKASLILRFLGVEGRFVDAVATLSALDLGCRSRAVLVTFKLPPPTSVSHKESRLPAHQR